MADETDYDMPVSIMVPIDEPLDLKFSNIENLSIKKQLFAKLKDNSEPEIKVVIPVRISMKDTKYFLMTPEYFSKYSKARVEEKQNYAKNNNEMNKENFDKYLNYVSKRKQEIKNKMVNDSITYDKLIEEYDLFVNKKLYQQQNYDEKTKSTIPYYYAGKKLRRSKKLRQSKKINRKNKTKRSVKIL